jgi:hypothetical protein
LLYQPRGPMPARSKLPRCRGAGAEHDSLLEGTEAPSAGGRPRYRWHVGIPLILPFSRRGKPIHHRIRHRRDVRGSRPGSVGAGMPGLITATCEGPKHHPLGVVWGASGILGSPSSYPSPAGGEGTCLLIASNTDMLREATIRAPAMQRDTRGYFDRYRFRIS